MNGSLLTAVGLGLLFGSPWLVASALLWRRGIRSDAAIPSMGEQIRNRWIS